MLILAKTVLAVMLGFIISAISGFIIIPILKKMHASQKINSFLNENHQKKSGTPTIGGLIFIISTIIALVLLLLRGSITITHNLIILVFVFIGYGIIGFLDDYLKMKRKNSISGSEGLTSI